MSESVVLQDVIDVFRHWLYLPDPGVLLLSMAAIAANRMDGDPVWLLVVGAPGHTKTEIINPLIVLDEVHSAATLTEPALLSGTSKKETARAAKGGLLREIGEYGVILCKDFGSVLNMQRDARASLLAALREIYDGAWVRHVGTDGGKSLEWKGKVGFIGGCTPNIDRAHAVMASMGERFLLYRIPDSDENLQARSALANVGHENRMRTEFREVIGEFFSSLKIPTSAQGLDPAETDRLVALTRLVAHCRSAVERDSYSREIELVPGSEAPTRLAKVLASLFAGLVCIGLSREEAWPLIHTAAADSVPAVRWSLFQRLYAVGEEGIQTRDLSELLGLPSITTRRALEDLAAHHITARTQKGGNKGDLWTLTESARDLAQQAAFPFCRLAPNRSVSVTSRRDMTSPSSSPFGEYEYASVDNTDTQDLDVYHAGQTDENVPIEVYEGVELR